jgi:hypothetical protein
MCVIFHLELASGTALNIVYFATSPKTGADDPWSQSN